MNVKTRKTKWQKLVRLKWPILALLLIIVLLVSGTLTYTNFLQREINEFAGITYNGVRLHDDYITVNNAEINNKDVYVENHGETPLFVRVKLKEFFTVGNTIMAGATSGAVTTDPALDSNWLTHIEGATNVQIDSYWNWEKGNIITPSSVKYYLPTELRNATDASADNVLDRTTIYDNIGNISTFNPGGDAGHINASHIGRYYSKVEHPTNGSITYETVTSTATSYVTTMAEWIKDPMPAGDFWVGDTDGWYYWANYLQPKAATGLLLDQVSRKQALADEYYYGIRANLEATTYEEVDKFTSIGDGAPSENAKNLFAIISNKVIRSLTLPANIANNNNVTTISNSAVSMQIAPTTVICDFDPLVSNSLKGTAIYGTHNVLTDVSGLSYSQLSGPSTLAINQATGVISGITTVGTYEIKIASVYNPNIFVTFKLIKLK